ncbi:hypothetical protein RUM44_013945 [Polyplax serrata]|uniref:HMG box domain-containing protein n=1 Tax=Polyplax serrata TaxID=468196 RepID=A0ABR1BJN6_POLSC
MESPDCEGKRSKGDLIKNKTVTGGSEEEPICNGQDGGDEDSKKANKRRASFSESDEGVGAKRVNVKVDDDTRGEIPAHHARRPPNGFLLFCKRHRDVVSAKNPNLENRGVTKLLGNWWRTLEEDERDKYKELARQNKEIFIANNPQFTWYKLPAPPLRTLVTRPSNRRPPKLEPNVMSTTGPITPGKLADESQLGGLTSLLSSSLSPPTTPVTTSPPLPAAPAPPKKRFLLQTRTKEEASSPGDNDDERSKRNFKTIKKKYKKHKNNSLKSRRNLKLKWSESISEKVYVGSESSGPDLWKSENGCTKQQLIEKIVDSSFDSQKTYQDYDIQRTLEYINTEHTYQKNPSRFWQQQKQQPKNEKRTEYLPLQVMTMIPGDGSDRNIISPNLNNNTIVLSETAENGKNGLNYSFNDNNNLIVDYIDPNQRKLDQSSIQTNHDRIRTSNIEDGYIPGGKKGCVKGKREDCDKSKINKMEDQKKPFQLAQVDNEDDAGEVMENADICEDDNDEEEPEVEDGEGDSEEDDTYEEGEDEDEDENEEEGDDEKTLDRVEIPRNCDRNNADFQSILGKVSREIVSMMKERDTQDADDMVMARFNVKSRSESDSEGSWYDKSDDSPPESPEGRRSKRSCKGRRYEQFIKDSVSKKRGKTSNMFSAVAQGDKKRQGKSKRRKLERLEAAVDTEFGRPELEASESLSNEKHFLDEKKDSQESENSQTTEDLIIIKQGTKASDIIQLKLDLELKSKNNDVKNEEGNHNECKITVKKKPISKVQMIKEKREILVGEFNLNEKIEELPLLSFESFLQKKRQRKKRLLGLRKEGIKSKILKNRTEKMRGKSSGVPESGTLIPSKPVGNSGQNASKPDFADLTTLAETALTLLSLREPR